MSLIENHQAREDRKRELQDQMKALIEEGDLQDASLGIAKVLATNGDLGTLTPAQRSVFDRYIKPLLTVPCVNKAECGYDIDDYMVADAIRNGREGLCNLCQGMQHVMERDD